MLPTRRIIAGKPVLGYIHDSFTHSTVYCQTFRWVRKPSWLPMAKSKVFKIPNRIRPPKDQTREYMRLNNHYHTHMASIGQYCKELVDKTKIVLDEVYIQNLEDEDFERCSKINEQWNKKMAEEREQRWIEMKNQKVIRIMERMERMDKKKQAEVEEMEAKIRLAKQQRPTFITEENIDQAIEQALSSVVSYDKILDKDGSLKEVKTRIQ